ncbi:hypothetical protein ScPMuIL_007549 [Solemya velum]
MVVEASYWKRCAIEMPTGKITLRPYYDLTAIIPISLRLDYASTTRSYYALAVFTTILLRSYYVLATIDAHHNSVDIMNKKMFLIQLQYIALDDQAALLVIRTRRRGRRTYYTTYVLLREGAELKLCHLFYSGYSAVTIHTVTHIVQYQKHPVVSTIIKRKMKTQSRFNKFLCVAWSGLEVGCFAGILYGWSALLFVLKAEGFYLSECLTDISDTSNILREHNQSYFETYHLFNGTNSQPKNRTISYDIMDYNFSYNSPIPNVLESLEPCQKQETRLNLWYSISGSATDILSVLIGPVLYYFGNRTTRLISIVVFSVGCSCVAFSNTAIPGLLLPGLTGMAIGGVIIYTTSIQVSNLFPAISSTIVAIFTGLFVISSFDLQIVKVGYEHGISRKYIFIAVGGLEIVLVLVSSFLILPSDLSNTPGDREFTLDEPKGDNINTEENTQEAEGIIPEPIFHDQPSLKDSVTNPTYLFHLFWMSASNLRFSTFIGLLNTWLEITTEYDVHLVSGYLDVFSYTTLSSVVCALVIGGVYDHQRREVRAYRNCNMKMKAAVLPMVLSNILSVILTSLVMIPSDAVPPYIAFVVFTVYRFPGKHFGVLYGILMMTCGVVGFIQYAIYRWCSAYQSAYLHVNIFLLLLGISTSIHPFSIWKRSVMTESQLQTQTNYQRHELI